MSKLLVLTVGHIAAGKTTLLRAISRELSVVYISEGAIKRQIALKSQRFYNYKNSLDETLRDVGYREAIRQMVDGFKDHDIVLLDASFHRQFRRDWVVDALRDHGLTDVNILVLWLFCSNEGEVQRRVQKRACADFKDADNQADHMDVYYHIRDGFDPVDLENFSRGFNVSMIVMDTYRNEIVNEQIAASDCEPLRWVCRFLKEEYMVPRKCFG